jgi:transcriptional regulator with XRE-family HTH domain
MAPLHEVCRERRVALGLTQEQAAIAAGLSRKTVSDFENGEAQIGLGNLGRLLRAIGLELATREASPRPTLHELADRYHDEEPLNPRRRARKKKAS